jgi:RND family efflux transporter MFP subunit
MRFHRVAALAAILPLTLACSEAPGGPPGGMAFPPAAVSVEPARLVPLEDATEYVATLTSLRSTAVQPQIDGQITQIFVKSGDRVERGAPIVQIDPQRQQAAVSSQEAERQAREADVAFARQQRARADELFKAGAISRQELEQADTAQQTAEARLKALQAQVQEQQVQLRYYTVAAPTAGIVGDVPARVGNQVGTQTVLTTIDQNDTLEVQVQVPIERASELKMGLPIRILTSDSSTTIATTTVNFISPRVDNQTQSVLVKGVVQNPDGRLRSSQYVRARLVWKTSDGLVVPVTAVLRINGQFFAFVAEEAGKGGQGARGGQDQTGRGAPPASGLVARQRAITVGPIVGDSYPVRSGISSGDRVIVSGVQRLADGAPISPTAASPQTTTAAPPGP